jgi:hypothetical protein
LTRKKFFQSTISRALFATPICFIGRSKFDEANMSPRSKKRLAFRQRSKHRKPGDAHTIPSFCESNAISESKYFDLKRKKKGPREIELDGRIIITPEAEADWRREREAETQAKRQAESRKASSTAETATI